MLEIGGHAVEGPGQFANLIPAGDPHLLVQVAGADDLGSFVELQDGFDHGALEEDGVANQDDPQDQQGQNIRMDRVVGSSGVSG